ncbi:MAG TPA: hypothetical protein VNT20_21365 [Flavisolibacter sp.]|jgi:hypothetical protein|nr:hypothetical protein [Flavisolibacter sp.]
MKASKTVRKKWFKLRVTEDELRKIKAFSKTSACTGASDYARNLLLQKPVIVKYRNGSADDILSEMIRLKNELNAIGNNFNQAVHRLHTLDRIPEIKIWLIQNEMIKQSFLKKVEEIRMKMIQIHEQWSQK